MFFSYLTLLTVLFFYAFYKWATLKYKTFERRGVPYEQPLPLIGNTRGIAFMRNSFFKVFVEFYRRNKAHKVVGFYNMREPIYMINDPACIKKITVKDFEYFPNHITIFNTAEDPLVAGMLNMMKDQRWKNMRQMLSPVFTAAKMRAMFTLMNECFAQCMTDLRQRSAPEHAYEFDLRKHFTRLTNDIIASTAFGLKINSFAERDNEFFRIGQSITNFRGKQMLNFIIWNVLPGLTRLLGLRIFDAHKLDYFRRLVVDTIKERERCNIKRPDMIQLVMEAVKESGEKFCEGDVVAQCFIFFFAAFENTANLICVICFELLQNADIQQRLHAEAVGLRAALQGAPLSYDDIPKLKYLDMVVCESLRKWSLGIATDRVCAKDYTLRDELGNLVFEFKAGDYIWIPFIGLLWDEAYFENPEVFDPERFSAENKRKIKPFTYTPFGEGPRNCIGNRYALMQVKAMLYYLILDFKIERSSKTVKNLFDSIRGFQVYPEDGFWMRFVPRQ